MAPPARPALPPPPSGAPPPPHRRRRPSHPDAVDGAAATPDPAAALLVGITALLDGAATLSRLDRFRVAVELLYAEGRRVGLSEDKARMGGINEALVALERGHTLSASMHGADSVDAASETHELKNSDVKARTSYKSNFIYAQPTRELGESAKAYVARIRAHWLAKSSGVHILSAVRGTRVAKSYEIDSVFMADYMAEWSRVQLVNAPADAQPSTHNIGSLPCARCGEYRRARNIATCGASYAAERAAWTPERWRKLFTTDIARNCVVCAPA